VVFSANSKRIAYPARQGDEHFVVVDGREGARYDEINPPPVFSPKGSRIAYGARRDRQRFVVVDGKEGQPYDAIVDLGASRIVFDSASSLHYLALRKDDIYLVEAKVDGF
jgi:hypothetical protein